MKVYSPILRLFGIGGLSNPDQGFQVGASSFGTSTDAGISVRDDRALQVSAVWSCVNLIANSVTNLPLRVYRKTDEGREEITGRHFLTDLLQISPNASMTPRDFRLAMTSQSVLWNNAYALIEWVGDRPVAITPLKPGRMAPYVNDTGEVEYHYSTPEGVVVYSKRSILHLKGIGADGLIGFERLSYARQTLGLSVSAETYAAKQFANGGNSAGGFLMFDDFLTQQQRETARELYSGMSETAYNANKLWLLEGGVKYQSNTLPPDTMQMLETRKMQIGEIARFFGVPEILLGSGSGSSAWPASFEQQVLSFLTFTLAGYLDQWETGLMDALVKPENRRSLVIDHDTTGFIRTDSQAKASYLATLVQNGLATRNEGRKFLNLSKVDGGDELTVQTNLTPVNELETINNASQNSQPNQPVLPEIRQ